MKTIREIRLERLTQIARENLANSDNAILRLYEDFQDGLIPANKVKRIAQIRIAEMLVDLKRYNSLVVAIDKDASVDNPAFWENHYNHIFFA